MAKLVFLKRTQKEIEIFGGDVYFDIDGKNAGKLSLTNQIVEIPAGEHTVKMYKSHTFDTFIGFAESVINVTDDEQLMIKYSAPMMINQPGNMVISVPNENVSRDIAKASKGIFVSANNNDAVDVLDARLKELSKSSIQKTVFSPNDEQFPIFAWLILALLVIDIFVLDRKISWLKNINFFSK